MAVEVEVAAGHRGKDQAKVVVLAVATGMVTAVVSTSGVMAGISPVEAEEEAGWAAVVATMVESARAPAPALALAMLAV